MHYGTVVVVFIRKDTETLIRMLKKQHRVDDKAQDCFLIADDGDLILKLAKDLMIGEDERGCVVLNPAPDEALLRINREPGCIALQALALRWTFCEPGNHSVQHLLHDDALTLRLTLPGSSLIITPDFTAQQSVDRDIRLSPTHAPALTLTRLVEPITLLEPANSTDQPDTIVITVKEARAETHQELPEDGIPLLTDVVHGTRPPGPLQTDEARARKGPLGAGLPACTRGEIAERMRREYGTQSSADEGEWKERFFAALLAETENG